ncbi:hypothetical protein F3Y22_tig00110328pilonHSYRG01128 [Hibiscus syriacus]|uniref:Uncharacterized protein n=1 Tax=Hibiscus syriacus TaxID=106335 RepID=A0A6A3B412_HIBSY|nr:hypothetical protein F3Y22_tig00110328pilonHSYRG01128 [Hibiscus syriacus]
MDCSKVDDGGSIICPPGKRRRSSSSEASVRDNPSCPAVMAPVPPSAEARGHTGYLTFARLKIIHRI